VVMMNKMEKMAAWYTARKTGVEVVTPPSIDTFQLKWISQGPLSDQEAAVAQRKRELTKTRVRQSTAANAPARAAARAAEAELNASKVAAAGAGAELTVNPVHVARRTVIPEAAKGLMFGDVDVYAALTGICARDRMLAKVITSDAGEVVIGRIAQYQVARKSPEPHRAFRALVKSVLRQYSSTQSNASKKHPPDPRLFEHLCAALGAQERGEQPEPPRRIIHPSGGYGFMLPALASQATLATMLEEKKSADDAADDAMNVTPYTILRMTPAAFLACGVPRFKMFYVQALAMAFWPGESDSLTDDALESMSEAEVRDALLPLRGIGEWTVKNFQMFYLNRPDMVPHDDQSLRKGMAAFYSLPHLPSIAEMDAIAERWAPHRTLGCLYMWHQAQVHPKRNEFKDVVVRQVGGLFKLGKISGLPTMFKEGFLFRLFAHRVPLTTARVTSCISHVTPH